jgi:hypothetical protein
MLLEEYKYLIKALPYKNQSFDVQLCHWSVGNSRLFAEKYYKNILQITINRNDLYHHNGDLEKFVFKTLMWGYPRKGRGKNIDKLLEPQNLNYLIEILRAYIGEEVQLEKFINDINSIPGLGLSTMSKFAYFLRTKIDGYNALILDAQVIKALNNQKFEELDPLKHISTSNCLSNYSKYLETMHSIAVELGVEADQVEYFLFKFGRGLSPIN